VTSLMSRKKRDSQHLKDAEAKISKNKKQNLNSKTARRRKIIRNPKKLRTKLWTNSTNYRSNA